jgi:hypothetical protein
MREDHKRMFGMSEQAIREQYMQSITARMSGMEMVVMGVLSDAQELLTMGRSEDARKQMNIAKFILCEMMDQNDIHKQYAKRKQEIAKDKRYGGFTV